MMLILAIALGSAAGGVARYAIGALVQRAAGSPFPLGTFAVNVLGSLLLGYLVRHAVVSPQALALEARAALTVGFCGGFTTFSTFTLETARLIESGRLWMAAAYAGGSALVSLLALFVGMTLARGPAAPVA